VFIRQNPRWREFKMCNLYDFPHITPKEKCFFAPFNHKRVIQIIRAGRCVNCLKGISPTYLNLDITWRCNYDCIGCIDGGVVGREEIVKDTSLDMDWELTQDLLEYAENHDLLGFIVQGGEPLLYPRIDDFLNYCTEKGFILRLVTNGSQILKHSEALISAFQIPKSQIRVSVNADEEHYSDFTKSKANLKTVLNGIEAVVKGGADVVVGSVVFGRNLEAKGFVSNIEQIESIFNRVSSIGVQVLVLLPGRHPQTKEMIPFEKDELDALDSLASRKSTTNVEIGGRFVVERELPARDQIKNYFPCPTALLRIVVGSDGRLYHCTEHRGESDAEIGRMSKANTFAQVWHSEQRVRRQLHFDPRTHCERITCDRHGINTTIEIARRGYEEFGCPSIIKHVLLDEDESEQPFF